uniref:Glutathione peroxidase n=1 Tax=Chenopodium quinoa TaxID=63459 RepID=A0A803L0S7_CHEQI
MRSLYKKYKDQAFPCNQFGWQEPGSNEEINEAVYSSFKAEFPLFQKIDVNGKNAAPLYKFLKSKKTGVIVDETKWNFAKILVDRQGSVVERYAPVTSPLQIEAKPNAGSVKRASALQLQCDQSVFSGLRTSFEIPEAAFFW